MNNNNIGKNRSEVNRIFRQFGITPFRNLLIPADFEQIADETIKIKRRVRVLTPEVVFWLMALVGCYANSMAGALRRSWHQMKGNLSGLPYQVVSQGAFTQARKKLPIAFFKRIFNFVLEVFHNRYPQPNLWHGLRVKIFDGMTLTLPESKLLRKRFGSRRNQHKKSSAPVQGHLGALFSAFSGVCLGFAFGNLRLGEQQALSKLIGLLSPGDLLLGDREYVGYRLWQRLMKKMIDFVFRLKEDYQVKKIKRVGKNEWLVEVKPPRDLLGRYSHLPCLTLRLIKYQIKGFRPMYLITSLVDAEKYPGKEIISLYPQRWQIETRNNELKNMIKIENLCSKTSEGIVKEIWTHLTVANLVRLMMLEAAEQAGEEAIDLSYLLALEKIIDTAVVMWHNPVHIWLMLYREMIEEISQMRILKRPGRNYPREVKRRSGVSGTRLFVEVSYVPVYKKSAKSVA